MLKLVASLALCLLMRWAWRRCTINKEEEEFATYHRCKPLRPWIARWPLGLEFLVRITWHVRNNSALRFFTESWELCTPTHAQRILFNTGIATMDPENIEAMLHTQFDDFCMGLRSSQFRDIFGEGFFTQDGLAWKHPRMLLRTQFASNRMENFDQIQECVESMLDHLPDHGDVDLQPLFLNLTLDTTLFLLFGKLASTLRADPAAQQRRKEFAKAFNDGQQYITYRVRLGPLYYLINTPRYWRTCRTVRDFTDDLVQCALNISGDGAGDDGDAGGHSIVEGLLRDTKDKKFVSDQCLSAMLAGRDSTSASMAWTMYLLVRHPRCLAKLRTSIASALGPDRRDDQPSRADLRRMTYLDAVIKESLRLYPPVPVNVREASRLTTLPVGGGSDGRSPVMVRPGQAITWSSYVVHRRKDIFGADAHHFRPERWEDDALHIPSYAYAPFGGGPRSCLGQDFAILEVGYTVVRLLQRFPSISVRATEVVQATGHEKQLMGLILSPAEGCFVHIRSSC